MTEIVFDTQLRQPRTLAYTISSKPDTIFINPRAWRVITPIERRKLGRVLESTLSHEEIHNVLTRLDEDSASYALDNLEHRTDDFATRYSLHGVSLPKRLRK